jgi:hypothetical protein
MNKQEATTRLAELIAEFQAKLTEMEAFANEHDLPVSVNILGQRHRYVPANPSRPTVQQYWDGEADDWDEEDGDSEWDGEYSGWQNSSTFC